MLLDSPNGFPYEPVRLDANDIEQAHDVLLASQPNNSITKNRLISVERSAEVADGEMVNEQDRTSAKGKSSKPQRNIHWVTPFTAALLWLIGLAAAMSHSSFLYSLSERPTYDQTWAFRYSLAMAFIFKSALGSCISLALAQYAWYTLRKSENGTSLNVIDAMFLSESSLLRLLSPALWKSATLTALIATSTWLMPLTAIVSPTALTVGTSVVNATEGDCTVPTIDWGKTRVSTGTTDRRALFVTDYSNHYIRPSITSERISAAVLNTGRQIGWRSPCGPNCTYDIQFVGPSWLCTQNANVDDPRAPWKAQFGGSYWYWGYGDGSNITVNSSNSNALLYSPIYYGGLNASTNQFWAGFASGANETLSIPRTIYGSSLQKVLGVQAYSCQIVNASYTLQVSYNNGIQQNDLQDIKALSFIDIAAEGWEGEASYTRTGEQYLQTVPIPVQDLIGMYMPMVNMLSGYINRDPRSTLVSNTSLGQIPSLIDDLPLNVTYAAETPYLPRRDLGSLLEELSQNLTISLMAVSSLFLTSSTVVPCRTMRTLAVWKVDWMPLIIAYAVGLSVSLICLLLGARALVGNRGAYDTAFSSILRTTRDGQLNRLVDPSDAGMLPIPSAMAKQRLEFVDDKWSASHSREGLSCRTGFRLRE